MSKKSENIPGGYRTAGILAGLGLFCVMYISEVSGYYDVPSLALDYYKSIVAMIVTLGLISWKFDNGFVQRIMDFSDKYSYGVYLTHHIFILGALSVMSLTPYWHVNVAIAIFAAIVSGILLTWLSDGVILKIRQCTIRQSKKMKGVGIGN